jgi:hypothetical protein
LSDFTISNAYVLMNCRFPFRPEVVMPAEVAADEDREKGNLIHDCAAKYINSACEQELLLVAESPTWACAKAWILANWNANWVAEPAYAWNPQTGAARRIGIDIHREYEKHGRTVLEKAGTLDVCSVEGDTVYVYEFGTGYDVSHKHEQLRLQCVVAARAHGCSRAVGQLVRFADDGAYPSPPVELDDFALAAIAGEFTEYLDEVDGSEPAPGEHCQRCNLAPVCPAAASIVQSIIPAESLVRPGWGLTIANADHAAWLLNHARLVAAAADAVKEAVKAYVPKTGLVLEDGSLLVEGARNMPRRDNKKMEALARAMGATDEQIAGCDYVAVESSGLKIKKPKAEPKARKSKAA